MSFHILTSKLRPTVPISFDYHVFFNFVDPLCMTYYENIYPRGLI